MALQDYARMIGKFDPIGIDQQITELRASQQQNRLADYAFAEKQKEAAREEGFNALYRDALNTDGSINRSAMITGAAQGGYGGKIPALQKAFAEQDKSAADLEKAKVEATTKKLDIAGKAFGYVRNNPTVEAASSALDYLGQNGIYTQEQVAQYKALAQANPGKIKSIADQAFQAALDAKDQLPKFETRNTGGTTDTIAINPVTGMTEVANSVKNTQSPDSKASIAATIRGQNMADARSREEMEFKRKETAAGKAPAGYRYKEDGTLEAIPGGPADIKAGELGAKRERQQQGALDQADRIITKVDQSLAKVGLNTAGFGGSALSMVPGSESRDLKADLETIKANLGFAELQAMRDASPTGGALGAIAVQELTALQSTVASLDQAQSPAQLKSRLGEIKTHYGNWKKAVEESRGAKKPSGDTQPKKIASDADYNALPSGAEFVDPNGQKRRKP